MDIAIPIEDTTRRAALFGTADRNLRLIRSTFDVRITARDGEIRLSGLTDDVKKATRALEELQRVLRSRPEIPEHLLNEILANAQRENGEGQGTADIDVFLPSAAIVPKGEGQQEYIRAVHNNDLTCCVGPAGTGKTFVAVAVAVSMLKRHKIKRIVLVRPAVEAGERIGYLPGDMQAKINPYLRPLFDAMHDMMTFEQIKRFMQSDVIEVVPLAFMRGRTLNHSVIILDEAQNSTKSQMLMFLTRLGHHSKMIITGDDSQSDLENEETSGLSDAVDRLDGIKGVAIVRLTKRDIVRHPLVQRVVEAYSEDERSSDN